MALLLAVTPVSAYAMEITPDNLAECETELLSSINEKRIEAGAAPFTYNERLHSCAEIRAVEAQVMWSHTRPDGTPWWSACDICYGEALGKKFRNTDDLLEKWMESEAHRLTILEPRYHTAAVSIKIADDSKAYVAIELGL